MRKKSTKILAIFKIHGKFACSLVVQIQFNLRRFVMGEKFNEVLREKILSVIKNFTLLDTYVVAHEWDSFFARILDLFVRKEIISEEEVLDVIHNRLKEIGRESFLQHIKRGKDPDHTRSPEALAYAILNNEITPPERISIKYDNDRGECGFLKSFNKPTLKEIVLERLWAIEE